MCTHKNCNDSSSKSDRKDPIASLNVSVYKDYCSFMLQFSENRENTFLYYSPPPPLCRLEFKFSFSVSVILHLTYTRTRVLHLEMVDLFILLSSEP